MCKCGHDKNAHHFVAWLPGACFDCNCDDYTEKD